MPLSMQGEVSKMFMPVLVIQKIVLITVKVLKKLVHDYFSMRRDLDSDSGGHAKLG